jgi:hypothetical protein
MNEKLKGLLKFEDDIFWVDMSERGKEDSILVVDIVDLDGSHTPAKPKDVDCFDLFERGVIISDFLPTKKELRNLVRNHKTI